MDSQLKVLLVATEATPFTKVGGLADVAGALPKALRRIGVDARLMIPRYGDIRSSDYEFQRVGGSVPVPVGSDQEPVHLLQTTAGDVPVYLIWNDQYLSNRERVYGFNDDSQRFVFFSRAVTEALKTMDWKPDVVHANDWHTAAALVWLDVYGRSDECYKDIATLFTVHNMSYQGLCGRLILTFAGMPDVPHLEVEPPGQVNWLAQGIAHADLTSTVSPTYAREMLSGEIDPTLVSLLEQKKDTLFGILSGIDTELWDPSQDEALTQTYDQDSVKMRSVNKTAFQRELRLPVDLDIPLLGVVSRLDTLKGLDLILSAVESLIDRSDIQFVLLGTGDPEYEARFQDLQSRFPQNVRALIRFDDRMARRIYSSVDLFVLPSRAEASSMGQMTAMHYGAVPVVRAVGGLADTVVDADADPSRGTGFTFRDYATEALQETLIRALNAFGDSNRWRAIQRRAMGCDFSWAASARAYVDLYRRAVAQHKEK
ncbi:MAG: glycogen synthase [Anaerolineae bacterium]|nr:glycogen synthase [Anaerolineae bacterium]